MPGAGDFMVEGPQTAYVTDQEAEGGQELGPSCATSGLIPRVLWPRETPKATLLSRVFKCEFTKDLTAEVSQCATHTERTWVFLAAFPCVAHVTSQQTWFWTHNPDSTESPSHTHRHLGQTPHNHCYNGSLLCSICAECTMFPAFIET